MEDGAGREVVGDEGGVEVGEGGGAHEVGL